MDQSPRHRERAVSFPLLREPRKTVFEKSNFSGANHIGGGGVSEADQPQIFGVLFPDDGRGGVSGGPLPASAGTQQETGARFAGGYSAGDTHQRTKIELQFELPPVKTSLSGEAVRPGP